MNYETMTKKALLEVAKDLEIQGRHDMSKDDLIEAIRENGGEEEDDEDVPELDVEVADKETLVNLKRRRPSSRERDSKGLVIRSGKNLSGNQPFARKIYALSEALVDERHWPAGYAEAVKAAPGQVQLILKFLREQEITGENGMTGGEIIDEAKAKGYLASKIDGRALFAYYSRLLQVLGVMHTHDEE